MVDLQFQMQSGGTFQITWPPGSNSVKSTIYPMPLWSERVYKTPPISALELVRFTSAYVSRMCVVQTFMVLAAVVVLIAGGCSTAVLYNRNVSAMHLVSNTNVKFAVHSILCL